MIFNADEKNVRVHGRTLFINGIRYIDYSCAGTAFMFTGKEVKVRLTSDFKPDPNCGEIFMPFCAVLVNGVMTKRFEVRESEAVYELYSSDKEETVEIELIKMSEAAFGKVGIVEFITDSDIPPVPTAEKERKIEFVGDSITCGYGIEGVVEKDTFNTAQENPFTAYAASTARAFGADFNLISWSGIGVYSSWVDENAEKPLDNWLSPVLYPCTDAAYCNDNNIVPFEPWDFSRFVPKVIVINLGTNDQSFTKGIDERVEKFRSLYKDYIKLIREKNPDAEIICSLGAMLDGLCDAVEKTVNEYSDETGDKHIHYLKFTMHTEADGIAADYHPSQNTHNRMVRELSAKITEVTGWNTIN